MTILDKPPLGLECNLYRNTATHASPTWSAIPKAINVKAGSSKTEAPIPSRESRYQKYRGALVDFEISFTYRKKAGTDSIFAALKTAYFAGTPIEFFVADGSSADSGTQGIRAYCEIMKMDDTQDLEAAQEVAITLKPTYYEESGAVVEPDWYVVP